MSLLSQPTQNVIDHIFTAAYSYTNAEGFQVQINTQLDGDVNIGTVNTSYELFVNGLTISQIATGATPYSWANFPAINTVNLSGNWLTSLSGGVDLLSVNVCGALVVTDGIDVAVGNITVAQGNFVTACGNIVAHGNIVVDGNLVSGGRATLSGTINAQGGSIYNPKAFSVNNNSGFPFYTGSNWYGSNYIGYVNLINTSDTNYLFLNTPTTVGQLLPGSHVELKIGNQNPSGTNVLNVIAYSSSVTSTVIGTISDGNLHEFVYFGSPTLQWIQLY